MPGRLPNDGFRGRFWAGFQGGSGQVSKVPGHSSATGFRKVPGKVPRMFRVGSGGFCRQGSRRDGSRTY